MTDHRCRAIWMASLVLIALSSCATDGKNSDCLFAFACQPTTQSQTPATPAASGSLDSSFGGGTGSVVQSSTLGGLSDSANAVAFDSTGRIVAIGTSADVSGLTFAMVYRYDADGSADTSFAPGGFLALNDPAQPTYYASAGGLGVDSSDRIVVSGETRDFGFTIENMTVWRVNPDGTIDSGTFNPGAGYLNATNAAGSGINRDGGGGLSIDGSGRIVITGASRGAPAIEMAAWRVTAAGALDTTFAGSGYVTDYFGASPGQNGGSLPLTLTNGDVVVTGYANPNNTCNYAPIWHYNSTGGLLGASQSPSPNCGDSAGAIFQDSLGHLVIAGTSTLASGNHMTIWRYTVAAVPTLDPTFQGTGYVNQPFTLAGASDEQGLFATLDSQDRIIVAGISTTPSGTSAVIWRYLASGALDLTFGGGTGHVAFTGTAGATVLPNDQGRTIHIDSAGRYVMAGTSLDAAGNTRMAVWRVNP